MTQFIQEIGRPGRQGQASMALIHPWAFQLVDAEQKEREARIVAANKITAALLAAMEKGRGKGKGKGRGRGQGVNAAAITATGEETNEEQMDGIVDEGKEEEGKEEEEEGKGEEEEEEEEGEGEDGPAEDKEGAKVPGGDRQGAASSRKKKPAVNSLPPDTLAFYTIPPLVGETQVPYCFRQRLLCDIMGFSYPSDKEPRCIRCCNGNGLCQGYLSSQALLESLDVEDKDLQGE
jgi:hypothetical protein